jgi:membrane protein DedA with SNARE-associated domain
MEISDTQAYMRELGENARKASAAVAMADTAQKNKALLAIADALDNARDAIAVANEQDLAKGKENGLDAALLDRLALTPARFDAMLEGLRQVAAFVAGSGDINIYMVLASAWLGAVLGDVSSFFIGRYFSDSLLNWRLLQSQRDWIIRGEAFFERYGIVSIVIGRFIGPIRPVMPLSAGILGMPTTPFIAVNLASALAWAPVYILPGYLLGASVDTGYSSTELGLIVLAALAVLLAFFYWVRHHFKF